MQVLNEDWTADVVGRMHKYRISNNELAARCIYKETGDGAAKSYSHQYLSTVLNGKKTFENEESARKTREVIQSALDTLIAERMADADAGNDGNDDAKSDGD